MDISLTIVRAIVYLVILFVRCFRLQRKNKNLKNRLPAKKAHNACRAVVWYRPLIFFSFFAISEAQKRGVRFFRHRTTLSAISRAVGGVEQRLNVPSHLTSPSASVSYSISALRRAPAELDPSLRCKFPANFLQISGRRRHWALYLAHINPRRIDRVN